jgi:lycopene cyclase domain-containing protein
MEYTVASVVSVAVVVLLDRLAGTRLIQRPLFWVFLLVMFCFKLIVNGYLTWRPIVIYGAQHQLGLRIITIPIEDFLFGFSMILLTLVVWEKSRS